MMTLFWGRYDLQVVLYGLSQKNCCELIYFRLREEQFVMFSLSDNMNLPSRCGIDEIFFWYLGRIDFILVFLCIWFVFKSSEIQMSAKRFCFKVTASNNQLKRSIVTSVESVDCLAKCCDKSVSHLITSLIKNSNRFSFTTTTTTTTTISATPLHQHQQHK